jgi:hypothetical protein
MVTIARQPINITAVTKLLIISIVAQIMFIGGIYSSSRGVLRRRLFGRGPNPFASQRSGCNVLEKRYLTKRSL